jgi:hypothetical protein
VFLYVDALADAANGLTRSPGDAVFMPIVQVLVNDEIRVRCSRLLLLFDLLYEGAR